MSGMVGPDDVLEAETIARVLVHWIKANQIPPDDAYAWARIVASVLSPFEPDPEPESTRATLPLVR